MYNKSNDTHGATITQSAGALRAHAANAGAPARSAPSAPARSAPSAPARSAPSAPARSAGDTRALWLCFLGVLGFSFTLPATRMAAGEIDPLILGPGRGVVAGLIAVAIIRLRRWPWPPAHTLGSLVLVAAGIALGFPLFTALALVHVPAQHAVLVVGLAPLFTSAFGALRSREHLPWAFWAFAGAGALSVVVFGCAHSSGGVSLRWADALLAAAVIVVALAYAEGGRLAVQLGGTRVICWAFALALPCTGACVAWACVAHAQKLPSAAAAWGFGYVSIISSLVAFSAWYRGLALGGVARGSQVQLLQPVLSVLWCALCLHEHVSRGALAAACGIVLCAAGSHWALPGARRSLQAPATLRE